MRRDQTSDFLKSYWVDPSHFNLLVRWTHYNILVRMRWLLHDIWLGYKQRQSFALPRAYVLLRCVLIIIENWFVSSFESRKSVPSCGGLLLQCIYLLELWSLWRLTSTLGRVTVEASSFISFVLPLTKLANPFSIRLLSWLHLIL